MRESFKVALRTHASCCSKGHRWLRILNGRAREMERLLQTKNKNHNLYSHSIFVILFNSIFFPRQLLSLFSFCPTVILCEGPLWELGL